MTIETNGTAIATRQTSFENASQCDRVSELTATLAVVRPVGMDDNAASEWMMIVLADTDHLSDAAFRQACKRARAECSHHGQVLKTMLTESAELTEFRKKMDAISKPFLRDHNPPQRTLPKTETQQLIASAAKGLKGGAA